MKENLRVNKINPSVVDDEVVSKRANDSIQKRETTARFNSEGNYQSQLGVEFLPLSKHLSRKRRRKRGFYNERYSIENETLLERQTNSRDQIFFEIKKLEESRHKESEIRLKNLYKKNLPLSYYARSRLKLGSKMRAKYIRTKLSFPTAFGAFTGEGYVHTSGKRNFEFLLLDWNPRLGAMIPILRIHQTNFSSLEVRNVKLIN